MGVEWYVCVWELINLRCVFLLGWVLGACRVGRCFFEGEGRRPSGGLDAAGDRKERRRKKENNGEKRREQGRKFTSLNG